MMDSNVGRWIPGLLIAALFATSAVAQDKSEGDDATKAKGPELIAADGWTTCVAIQGDRLAAGGGQSLQYRPGEIAVWDFASGKRVADLKGHESNVWAIAFSSDGKRIVSAGYNGEILRWDPTQPEPLGKSSVKGWVRALQFTPDDSGILVGCEDGTVRWLDAESGEEVRSWKAHEAQVMDLALSADGGLLASASADKSIKLWTLGEEPAEKAKLEGSEDAVWSIAFSPDGKQLVSGGADRKVRLWDVASAKAVGQWEGHHDWVSSVAFHPEGKQVVSVDLAGYQRLWDVAENKQVQASGPAAGSLWVVAFADDGRHFIVGGRKHQLTVRRNNGQTLFPRGSAGENEAIEREWPKVEEPLPEDPEKKDDKKKEAGKKKEDGKEPKKDEAPQKEPAKKAEAKKDDGGKAKKDEGDAAAKADGGPASDTR